MDPSFILLSLFATSAALLGICVGMLNFTYSALLNPNLSEISIGDKDYRTILKRTSVFIVIAGMMFWINTIFDLMIMWKDLNYLNYSICIFSIGTLFIFISLIHDKLGFKWLFPETKPPETKEMPKIK